MKAHVLIAPLAIALVAAAPDAVELLAKPVVPIVIPERVSRDLPLFVRQAMVRVPKPEGDFWPPESAEELARPIVPEDVVALTLRRGAVSAALELCGINPDQTSFLPFMQAVRRRGGLSERQLAFVAQLHGATQGVVSGSLTPAICTPDNANAFAGEIARGPWLAP